MIDLLVHYFKVILYFLLLKNFEKGRWRPITQLRCKLGNLMQKEGQMGVNELETNNNAIKNKLNENT